MVDSRRLSSRHQHYLTMTTRLVCDEVRRRIGTSHKRLRFAIRVVVAALRAPHPALDNPETRLPDPELVRELEDLVLQLLDLPGALGSADDDVPDDGDDADDGAPGGKDPEATAL
jgi:hypothetical protein